ncbi:MAG: AMP-dependent synthetase [Hyphomicrobiales bacterium]|nr:AMP-dependent synthetase [Hyphomicrobiales bacterium]
MLPQAADYETLIASFRWNIPDRLNIGVAVCDAWATTDPQRPALVQWTRDGLVIHTYDDLRRASNRLAQAFLRQGVRAGERVALLLPQSPETLIAHIAIYKIGAVALPLAALFGVDALEYRLTDSQCSAIVTDAAGVAKLRAIGAQSLPDLRLIWSVDGSDGPVRGLPADMARETDVFTPVDTGADDPALMIYTSGTTGQAKGALHGHRVLLGHVPGVQFPHEFLPQPGDRIWTPADWAWAGGLLNVLLPSLYLGVAVVCRKFERFDPEAALALIDEAQIRNAFIPPTALRMLRAIPEPRKKYRLDLRTMASGGESLGAEVYEWGRAAFGLTINEFYGQTECNLVLASCASIGVSCAGAIGKAVPGHEVAVIRDDGSICEPGEMGQVAIKRPNPVMFLEYWKRPEATADKFVGDWMTTGDLARQDDDGYVFFVGRDDDVITSSGYRIGPGEIEDCLLRHPAVSIGAAVGKPDALRTEIVKAFIVLKAGYEPSTALADDIREFVRARLSAHEYPREIAFVGELPLTTSGKVIRRLLRDQA